MADADAMVASADRFVIGGVTVHRLADIEDIGWLATAMFKDVTPDYMAAAAAHYPDAVSADGAKLQLSFNSYIIDKPGCLCLVDAGIGNGKDRGDRLAWHRRTGDFMKNMRALGYQPEQFDIVINTHLHADHVGWNTVLEDGVWVPAFPNARYIVPAVELDYWQARAAEDPHVLHGAYADSVKPLVDAGRYEAVSLPADIAPGLRLEAAPGHTPGMAVLRLVAGQSEMLFLADVIHSPVQLSDPDLTTNFCADPSQARATRHRLLDAAAQSKTIVAPYHFPSPVFGHILKTGDGYAFRRAESDG